MVGRQGGSGREGGKEGGGVREGGGGVREGGREGRGRGGRGRDGRREGTNHPGSRYFKLVSLFFIWLFLSCLHLDVQIGEFNDVYASFPRW